MDQIPEYQKNCLEKEAMNGIIHDHLMQKEWYDTHHYQYYPANFLFIVLNELGT